MVFLCWENEVGGASVVPIYNIGRQITRIKMMALCRKDITAIGLLINVVLVAWEVSLEVEVVISHSKASRER